MRVSDQGGPLRARGGDEERVTPLELFFDLVFVFALTQVAGFLVDHLTWLGMLKASALLTVLWSSWAVYSWLTNAVPAEEVIPARLVIFAATAAMFVASLAVPDAFGEYGVLFGLAYFVVFLLQVLLFALATGGEPEQRRAILRLARRRTAGDYPVRGAVWRRGPLPPRTQRLQAA
jgi:low temperature requirement protein LtrA